MTLESQIFIWKALANGCPFSPLSQNHTLKSINPKQPTDRFCKKLSLIYIFFTKGINPLKTIYSGVYGKCVLKIAKSNRLQRVNGLFGIDNFFNFHYNYQNYTLGDFQFGVKVSTC